ncbi:MAG: aminoacyltransferase [Actinobacteria bacterium]|nr:aminoacyltransferase [Actinomycetota bacterium]
MTLTVRAINADQHAAWVATQPSVSFLQVPEWGRVKVGWRPQSVGWFDGDTLVAAALVLYRPIPRVRRRSLAYIPEGPPIDWLGAEHPRYRLTDWSTPLIRHCRDSGAFQVKMGPPVALRRWDDETVKAALADAAQTRWPRSLGEVLATWHSGAGTRVVEHLRAHGWRQEPSTGAGFGDVQPRYVFQLALADRSLDDIWAGFNQQWRRNIRKAEKADVVVSLGGREDLAAFHTVYVETAHRDRFTPRGLEYFQRLWDAFHDPARTYSELSLHCARIEGRLVAASVMIRIGDHAWYTYGASTGADREARPSNALQWHMITHAHAAGCSIYDMRGISDTLDPENHLIGLVQFKVGSGGYAQEYAGEWDRAVRPGWARAYDIYRKRRG